MAIKVTAQYSSVVQRELAAFEHLNKLPKTKHAGSKWIRKSVDQFILGADHISPLRPFQCFVFKLIMASSLWSLRHKWPDCRMPKNPAKVILQHVIQALDYLHRKANMIHAGLSHASHHALRWF